MPPCNLVDYCEILKKSAASAIRIEDEGGRVEDRGTLPTR
jgi:hypothetical protein